MSTKRAIGNHHAIPCEEFIELDKVIVVACQLGRGHLREHSGVRYEQRYVFRDGRRVKIVTNTIYRWPWPTVKRTPIPAPRMEARVGAPQQEEK